MPRKKIVKKSPSSRTKFLFLIGFLLIVLPVLFYSNQTIQLMFFTPNVPVIAKLQPPITRIRIPKFSMDLPVFEQAITGGVWQIAPNGISHLQTSARPGEAGPIILYGHNTKNRFGPIRWLKHGESIVLTTSDGKEHRYTVTNIEQTYPKEVNLLADPQKKQLILYTCDGLADLKRFLVYAE